MLTVVPGGSKATATAIFCVLVSTFLTRTCEPEVMERVLRRGVERARREEWSTEGFVRLENRRIPTGKRKKEGEESRWKRLVVGAVELMTCLVEHSIKGFLLLSTIFNQNHCFSFLSSVLLLPPIVLV